VQTSASNDPVFVFGSNLAGRHGKGAALWARQHRAAIYGRGVGYQGNAYAIPTKDHDLRVLPLPAIQRHVIDFIRFAQQRPDLRFELTPIGCGLAGYQPAQIAPMFANAPANVILPEIFRAVVAGGPPPSQPTPQGP
jgi:hypothetical protein